MPTCTSNHDLSLSSAALDAASLPVQERLDRLIRRRCRLRRTFQIAEVFLFDTCDNIWVDCQLSNAIVVLLCLQ